MEKREFLNELGRKMEALGFLPPGAPSLGDVRIEGCVVHRLIGPDGRVKQEGMYHNLVTSVGDMYLAQLVAFVSGATVGSVAYAQLGTTTTAPVKGDTALGNLIAASSRGITATYPQRVDSFGTGPGEWTMWRYDWPAGIATNGSIGETGMWTSVGSFVARAIVSPNVNKSASDTLQVDWAWKFLGA